MTRAQLGHDDTNCASSPKRQLSRAFLAGPALSSQPILAILATKKKSLCVVGHHVDQPWDMRWQNFRADNAHRCWEEGRLRSLIGPQPILTGHHLSAPASQRAQAIRIQSALALLESTSHIQTRRPLHTSSSSCGRRGPWWPFGGPWAWGEPLAGSPRCKVPKGCHVVPPNITGGRRKVLIWFVCFLLSPPFFSSSAAAVAHQSLVNLTRSNVPR